MSGERVRWSGRPGQGVIFTARDFFLIPFSLLWCGLAIFWTVMATQGGARVFFQVWGLMFVCIGLFFTLGRFAVDAWLRGRIRYAVTDRRILILREGPFMAFTALELDRLPELRLSEGSGGRGTIRFGQSYPMWRGQSFGMWTPALDPTPQFIAIDDVKSVFDLVQRGSQTNG